MKKMLRKKTIPAFLLPLRYPVPAFLAITLFLSFTGCAKIADPLPPEILIPMAAVDLTAQQHADYVLLKVSLPKWNTNGTPVTTLQRVEVYRLTEDSSGASSRRQIPENQFLQKADPILSIPEKRLPEYRLQDLLVIEDRLSGLKQSVVYTRAFRYAVLFVNNKNQAAGFSNQAVVELVVVPLPPKKIAARITETSLDITWAPPSENRDGSKPARISGYNIYRTEEPEKFPTIPVNTKPLQNPEFKDVHFHFDGTYHYRVSVLGGLGEVLVESSLSDTLTVTPRDIFSPKPVENFNVIFEGETALLLWNPSPSPDVDGYRIHRRSSMDTEGKLLQEDLIAAYSFRDKSILPGREYEYSIVAVDSHGNESTAVAVKATAQ